MDTVSGWGRVAIARVIGIWPLTYVSRGQAGVRLECIQDVGGLFTDHQQGVVPGVQKLFVYGVLQELQQQVVVVIDIQQAAGLGMDV